VRAPVVVSEASSRSNVPEVPTLVITFKALFCAPPVVDRGGGAVHRERAVDRLVLAGAEGDEPVAGQVHRAFEDAGAAPERGFAADRQGGGETGVIEPLAN
jgi:hypothetical protein